MDALAFTIEHIAESMPENKRSVLSQSPHGAEGDGAILMKAGRRFCR
jgi:hypothetical protein